jgi:transposase
MNATAAFPVVGIDLSKNVFELAVADEHWRITERARLTRSQFERWFANHAVGLVVMESCGSAHHWARWLAGLGIEARLLPARYVRAYVKRNKTDAADAAALLEAARASDIVPVRVKSSPCRASGGEAARHRSAKMVVQSSINELGRGSPWPLSGSAST